MLLPNHLPAYPPAFAAPSVGRPPLYRLPYPITCIFVYKSLINNSIRIFLPAYHSLSSLSSLSSPHLKARRGDEKNLEVSGPAGSAKGRTFKERIRSNPAHKRPRQRHPQRRLLPTYKLQPPNMPSSRASGWQGTRQTFSLNDMVQEEHGGHPDGLAYKSIFLSAFPVPYLRFVFTALLPHVLGISSDSRICFQIYIVIYIYIFC